MSDNQLEFTSIDDDLRIESSESVGFRFGGNDGFVIKERRHSTNHYLIQAFYWEPKEDITAYELALCLPHLFGPITQAVIDSLPEQVKRHFKPV